MAHQYPCKEPLGAVQAMFARDFRYQHIKDVKIAPGLSKEERIEQFLRQIGNPYCFRCNGCVVQVSFSETERTLEDCLQDYFSNLV